tara:strand:- start:8 stop:223 length:216 start_codon:yes stop_codon:yes gene_type:complete
MEFFKEEDDKLDAEIYRQEKILEKLRYQKRVLQRNKYNFCKETTGHQFVYEIEMGPYGCRFRVCTRCGFED